MSLPVKMIQRLILIWCLAFTMATGVFSPAVAADFSWDWTVDGALNLSLVDWYGVGLLPREQSGVELGRLRGTVRAWYGENLSLEAAYELNANAGSSRAGSGLEINPATTLRLTDLERELVDGDDWTLAHNLDRLNAFYLGQGWEAMLGRQAISHGPGRFFNPTDIFAPISPQSTYSQYKAGVDAVRVSKPFGEAGEVEGWLVAHDNGWEKAYYLARGRWMLPRSDISAFGGYTLGDPTLGVGVSGDVAGASVYGEAFIRFDERPLDRLRVMAGAHYRFDIGTGLNVFAEGHYNGPGQSRPEDYGLVLQTPEFRNGELFLTGRWYTVASADYQPHPLVTCQMLWLQNLTDASALLMPIVDWEAKEWLIIRLGASVGLGKRPDSVANPLAPGGQVQITKSEFGTYANVYYLEMRFTF